MGTRLWPLAFLFLLFALGAPGLFPQAAKTGLQPKIIHNQKGGIWGRDPQVYLQLIRAIGGQDVEDSNLAFKAGLDVVLDSTGNMYILDSGNQRIQKLDVQGKFIQSIGRKGQGPGEFEFPYSLDVDDQDAIYAYDFNNRKIQVFTSEGKISKAIKFSGFSMSHIRVLRSGLIVMGGDLGGLRAFMQKKQQPLIEIVDQNGKRRNSFGEMRDYKNTLVNSWANWFCFDRDAEDNIYLTFLRQNRIEKYTAAGILLWTADRTLNYGTGVIDKGFIRRTPQGISIQQPRLNEISAGISVDGRGRVWVITQDRQMSEEERGYSISAGGMQKTVALKIEKMDIFKLEVFGPDGVLLGEIPLNHLAHGIRIFGDTLFIMDYVNAVLYQYKVAERDRQGHF
jgi:sugar lactone lactonase YvrE